MRMAPLRMNPIRCRRPTPVDNHTAAPMNAMVRRLPARIPFTIEKVLLAGGVAPVVCSMTGIKVNQIKCTANQNFAMRDYMRISISVMLERAVFLEQMNLRHVIDRDTHYVSMLDRSDWVSDE